MVHPLLRLLNSLPGAEEYSRLVHSFAARVTETMVREKTIIKTRFLAYLTGGGGDTGNYIGVLL
jgi:hypothetical protein